MERVKREYSCKISGKICPFNNDEWEDGMARDIVKDNCPIREYKPDDQIMTVGSNNIQVYNDWCKHLISQ